MRYVQRLIDAVRRRTLNEDNTSTAGIQDYNILDHLNDAQDRLLDLVAREHQRMLLTTQTISLVASTRAYDLTADIYASNKIYKVEYSDTGESDDYRPVQRGNYSEFTTEEVDDPTHYDVWNGQIILSPVPQTSNGTLRVTYVQKWYDLGLRAGKISSDTDTTIVLALSPTPNTTFLEELDDGGYICVVNSLGTVQHSALPCTDYNAGTRTITGTFTGLTIAANDYVVCGKYASSHCQVPEDWQRYLIYSAVLELLANEEDADANKIARAERKLAREEEKIIDALWGLDSGLQQPVRTNRYYV